MDYQQNNIVRRLHCVSELTSNIKVLLEDNFSFIWIYGEISNFRIPASGHFYFTLKDDKAQINAVMFRGQNRKLKFRPEEGMSITGLGRISVYEPRGTYQIILEYLEPKGAGALHTAYQQLKERLAAEGLFDEKHKKPIPFLPKKISIITSPTGAVIHDILKIINRRFSDVQIEIVPVKVQGDGADTQIVSGLELMNERADTNVGPDVVIIARGGGSIEDFNAFNSEDVARAVFVLKIPVISAIGHETDFTITDFVADLRAPTPSAAAELVVPLKKELEIKCAIHTTALKNNFYRYIKHLRTNTNNLSNRLVDPKKKLQDSRLKIDDFTNRLSRLFLMRLQQYRERLAWRNDILYANNPLNHITKHNKKLEQINDKLFNYFRIFLTDKHSGLHKLIAQLNALSPLAILDRGYSITRTIPGAVVVKDPEQVSRDQELDVMVAKGSLVVKVQKVNRQV